MALLALSVSCDLCHTLEYEETYYRGPMLAKRGWIWNTLVNVASKVKSNKTLKIKIKPTCVAYCDKYMVLTALYGSDDISHIF